MRSLLLVVLLYAGVFIHSSVQERDGLIATLTGADFLHYNLTEQGKAIESYNDTIQLSFKTTSGDGLLFYTGDSKQYLNIGLSKGVIYLAMDLGDGEEVDRVGTGRQFDDGYWHDIVISRESSELVRKRGVCTVSISVDNMYEASRSFAGSFSELVSSVLFVGGAYSLKDLPGSLATQNFRGCLKEVKFKAGSAQLVMLRLAESKSPLLFQQGDVSLGSTCKPVPQDEAVSILHPQDTLLLRSFGTMMTNFMTLTFRTTVKDGLLVYAEEKEKSVLAIEIFEGYLYIILDHTEVTVREKLGTGRVDDGEDHHLRITLRNWGASVELNDEKETVSVGDQRTPAFRLSSPVYLAGINDHYNDMVLHSAVYTAGLRRGFVGCLKDVKIDGAYQDLKKLSRQQGIQVSLSCNQSAVSCSVDKCKNGGSCVKSWQVTACDCTQTPFTGNLCTDETVTIRFNGDQHFTISPTVKLSTIADDIALQFRTKHSHGALLNSRSKDRRSGLDIFLYLGKLYIQITLVGTEHLLLVGENLNDYQWHSLTLKRVGDKVKVTVDTKIVIDEELPVVSGDDSLTIVMDEIKLGQPIDAVGVLTRRPDDDNPSSKTPFIGHIRQLVINNIAYLQLSSKGINQLVTYTAEMTSEPVPPINPVHFGSTNTFVTYNLSTMAALTTLSLQFKTEEAHGLVLFRTGRNQDFFALELVQGALSYIYSINQKVQTITSNPRSELNNNEWHDVVLMKLNNGSRSLVVDNVTFTSTANVRGDLRLNGLLYVAGVPKDKYIKLPPFLQTSMGYKGCIASLDINGVRPDLSEGRGNKHKLFKGCEDKTTYYFGGSTGGLILYTFPQPNPDTTKDTLVFGFITFMRSRATLMKQTSSTYPDFMEVILEDGKITVLYNIGAGTHTLTHPTLVNDGVYHVVRFSRTASNSSLQIDDSRPVRAYPIEDQFSVFNSQSQMTIGSHMTKSENIEDPFVGYISAVNINGIAVLRLAEVNHPTITIQGDARLTDKDESGMLSDGQPPGSQSTDDIDMEQILLPSGPSPCMAGLNADICNEDPRTGEIVDRTIVVSSTASAIVTKRPVNTWPIDDLTTRKQKRTTKAMAGRSTSWRREETTPFRSIAVLEQSTHGPFDLERNIPLIAGICGAALLTVIFIAVIIYRLTRKDNNSYATPQHRPSYSIDEDLKNNINGQRTNCSTPNMALATNGLSHRSGSKEWYV